MSISYPGSGGNFADLERQAKQYLAAQNELERKVRERQGAEEKSIPVEEQASRARVDLAGTTRDLSAALATSTSRLRAETQALSASTAALRSNASARAEVMAASRGLARAPAAAAPVGGVGVVGAGASTAQMDAQMAMLRRQADQQAQLVSRMEASQARLRAASLGTGGLSRGASGYLAVSGYDEGGIHRTQVAPPPSQRAPLMLPQRAGATMEEASKVRAAAEAEGVYTERAREHARVVTEVSRVQKTANLGINEAAAAYANSANALSRNGALTTEFIQAFARGEVTMREFGSQMLSTVGKFGGWLVAGAAVYGVVEALKHVKEGAFEAQAAVQQLGRFIPGLGGPAGGGRGQIGAAMSTVRSISTEFNVPSKQVVDTMGVMARTFHSVSQAGMATRAVLGAVRLDQVPAEQAQYYFQGIARSFGYGQKDGGDRLIGVLNGINNLQATYGPRATQVLPGMARAAPAAVAGGLDQGALMAMVGLGTQSGLTGAQVGTGIIRSITNFAFSAASQQTFRQYGITPVQGQYGQLVRQVAGVVDSRAAAGRLSGQDLTNLSRALGGPLQSRTFLPLLAQEAQKPGSLQRYISVAEHGRPYQEDLGAVLGTVSERFKSLGIGLENFGNRLAQIGAFQPLVTGLSAIQKLMHWLEMLTNPIVSLVGVFNQLPGVVKDAVAAMIAFRVGRAMYNSTFGMNAQNLIGGLPGMQTLRSQPREAIQSTVSRLDASVLPQLERQQAAASARLLQARIREGAAADEMAAYVVAQKPIAMRAGESSKQYSDYVDQVTAYEAELGSLTRASGVAADEALTAERAVARTTADIKLLKSSQYSTQQKLNYMLERQLVLETEQVSVMEDTMASSRAMMEGRGAAAGGAAGAAAAGGAAAAARQQAERAATQESAMMAAAVVPPRLRFASETAVAQQSMSMRESMALGLLGAGAGLQGLGNRGADLIARVRATSMEQRVAAMTSGPGMMAALLGTTMLGQVVPGGAGQFIQNVGGQAVTGGLIASMVRPGSARAGLYGVAAGTVAGSFQQGSGQGLASLAGGGIGAGIGFALGGPLGAGVGAMLGSMGGSVIGQALGLGGDKNKAVDAGEVNREVQRAIANANKNAGSLTQFGADFTKDLETAFLGTGQAAQRAQQKVGDTVSRLQAEVQLFGRGSPQGQAALKDMHTIVGAAIEGATTDPTAALNVLQSMSQTADQQLQEKLKTGLANAGPGQSEAVAHGVGQAYYQDYMDSYGNIANQLKAGLETAQANYDKIVNSDAYKAAHGDMKGLAPGVRKAAESAKATLDLARSAANDPAALTKSASDAANASIQAAALAGYQQDAQERASRLGLTVANAGGDRTAALKATLAAQQVQLQKAQLAGGLGWRAQADEMNKAEAAVRSTQDQIKQQGLAELQSSGKVSEARISSGDPVGLAQQQLRDLQDQYNYIKKNKGAFDPSQINDALAAVIEGKKAVAAATLDYKTQLNDINTQIAQAGQAGDSVAQAATGVAGAARDVAAVRNGSPQQKASAQLQYLNSLNQEHQAGMQRIQAQGQLQSALDWGDPAKQAQDNMATAQKMLSNAHGIDEQIAAEAMLAQAQQQYHDAQMQLIQAQTALAQSQHPGDATAQAAALVAGAQQLLANAHGPLEQVTAQTALNNAYAQQHAAVMAGVQSQGQLEQSQHPEDSVAQAQIGVAYAQLALRYAQGVDEQKAAEIAVNQANLTLHQARMGVIEQMASITQATEVGDAELQARTEIALANRLLHSAVGPDERRAALLKKIEGENALHDAQVNRASERAALATARAGNDPVRAAQIAVAAARKELSMARGIDERIKAETDLANAQNQLNSALQNHISALGAYAASLTREPLEQLQAQMDAVWKELLNAKTPAEKLDLKTKYNELRNQYETTLIGQKEAHIDFQLQMQQISTQQAIDELEQMLKMKDLTKAEREQIELKIRQLQEGGTGGAFNMMPGNIKLPTVYDVQKALLAAGLAAGRDQIKTADVGAQHPSGKAHLGDAGTVGQPAGGGHILRPYHPPESPAERERAARRATERARERRDHVTLTGRKHDPHAATDAKDVTMTARDVYINARNAHFGGDTGHFRDRLGGGGSLGGAAHVHLHGNDLTSGGAAKVVGDHIDRALGSNVAAQLRAAGFRGT